MPADLGQILVPFGFTGLESEVYTFLLQESPATGYRVSQAIRKPAANTYKALESLQSKGAVVVDQAGNRACRAIPPDELLAKLTRDFEWRRAEAEMRLASLDSRAEDDRVYALRSRAQLIERTRKVLFSSERVVLMACAWHLAHEVREAISGCVGRKVRVLVCCPEPLDIPGLEWGQAKTRQFEELRLVADGAEHIVALLRNSSGQVNQAIWSRSAFLSSVLYRGLSAEFRELGLQPPEIEETLGFANLA